MECALFWPPLASPRTRHAANALKHHSHPIWAIDATAILLLKKAKAMPLSKFGIIDGAQIRLIELLTQVKERKAVLSSGYNKAKK